MYKWFIGNQKGTTEAIDGLTFGLVISSETYRMDMNGCIWKVDLHTFKGFRAYMRFRVYTRAHYVAHQLSNKS